MLKQNEQSVRTAHFFCRTTAHPVELNERLTPGWTADSGEYFWRTFAQPVAIEDDCWIGGGVIVPGVKPNANVHKKCE